MLLDIASAYGEASALHATNSGYFSVLQKGVPGKDGPTVRQSSYRLEHLDTVMKAIGSSKDTYISQSSFVRPRRRIVDLADLGCAWVDVDCYKLGHEATEEFALSLVDRAYCWGIPRPTYIMHSGRGLYLKWLFTHSVNASEIHRWNSLQNVLTSLYQAIGADLASRDAARYLRVVGSVNSSAQSDQCQVKPIWCEGKRYTFQELLTAAAAVDLPEIKDITTQTIRTISARVKKLKTLSNELHGDTSILDQVKAEQLREYGELRKPILLSRFGLDQLNWQRFLDLRDLTLRRGGMKPGCRDLSLFWMGTFLAHSGIVTVQNFESEMRALAQCAHGYGEDFNPLEDQSLSTLLSRLRARDRGETVSFNGQSFSCLYTPTNARLIDIFEITPDEQAQLHTIIDAEEKQRRSDAKAPGRSWRRQERVEWHARVFALADAMVAKGEEPSPTAIGKAVNMHKSQVSRLLSNRARHTEMQGKNSQVCPGSTSRARRTSSHTCYPNRTVSPCTAGSGAQHSESAPACRPPHIESTRTDNEVCNVVAANPNPTPASTTFTCTSVAEFPLSSEKSQKGVTCSEQRTKANSDTGRPQTVEHLEHVSSAMEPQDLRKPVVQQGARCALYPSPPCGSAAHQPHKSPLIDADNGSLVNQQVKQDATNQVSQPPWNVGVAQRPMQAQSGDVPIFKKLCSTSHVHDEFAYLDSLDDASRNAEIARLIEVARNSDQQFKAAIQAARAHEESLRQAQARANFTALLEKAGRLRAMARQASTQSDPASVSADTCVYQRSRPIG